ncbi:MAG: hypothetical protein WD625_11135, partial [Balneolales bacterium]
GEVNHSGTRSRQLPDWVTAVGTQDVLEGPGPTGAISASVDACRSGVTSPRTAYGGMHGLSPLGLRRA